LRFSVAARGEGRRNAFWNKNGRATRSPNSFPADALCFQTLRALDSARFPLALEEASAVEGTLRRDPAGVYAAWTRRACRIAPA
jgi:hypothetical protein